MKNTVVTDQLILSIQRLGREREQERAYRARFIHPATPPHEHRAWLQAWYDKHLSNTRLEAALLCRLKLDAVISPETTALVVDTETGTAWATSPDDHPTDQPQIIATWETDSQFPTHE